MSYVIKTPDDLTWHYDPVNKEFKEIKPTTNNGPYKFSNLSIRNLETCHYKLQQLFNEVIKRTDCIILEGHRTKERQAELFKKGTTKTMNSKHLYNPSRAVDVAPYPLDWNDIKRFFIFGTMVKTIAEQMGIKIEWGGDWKSFKDYPHYQLSDDEK